MHGLGTDEAGVGVHDYDDGEALGSEGGDEGGDVGGVVVEGCGAGGAGGVGAGEGDGVD